jgi:hypothetical protein
MWNCGVGVTLVSQLVNIFEKYARFVEVIFL